MPSFDIVSKTDLNEVDNAVDGLRREIASRRRHQLWFGTGALTGKPRVRAEPASNAARRSQSMASSSIASNVPEPADQEPALVQVEEPARNKFRFATNVNLHLRQLREKRRSEGRDERPLEFEHKTVQAVGDGPVALQGLGNGMHALVCAPKHLESHEPCQILRGDPEPINHCSPSWSSMRRG